MTPRIIHKSVRNPAERRLFKMLADEPGTDGWFILHSLGFPAAPARELRGGARKLRSEADFVIICPLGVFVIEVKGGPISRKDNKWYTTNRRTMKTEGLKESPWEQAQNGAIALGKRVKKIIKDHGSRTLPPSTGSGVILAGTRKLDAAKLECENDITLYDTDIESPGFLVDFIKGLARYRDERYTPGKKSRRLDRSELKAIREELVGDFTYIESIGSRVQNARHEIKELTNEQRNVIIDNENNARLLVEGGAGTGKTILALHAAQEAANDGKRVLFCCYNKILSGLLANAVKDYDGIDVIRSEQLMNTITSKANRGDALFQCGGDLDARWEIVASSINEIEPTATYDIAIMDEAQDYMEPAFEEALEFFLDGGVRAGCWRAFLDSNEQAPIYGRCDPEILASMRSNAIKTIPLTVNCRNAQEVTNAVESLTGIACRPRFKGGIFKPIASVPSNEQSNIVNQLGKLIQGNDFKPGQITVLSVGKLDGSLQFAIEEAGIPCTLVDDKNVMDVWNASSETVTLSTVSSFKGLENDVVLVTGLATHNGDDLWKRANGYVGMTRARFAMYITMGRAMVSECQKQTNQRQLQHRGVLD